MADNRFDRSTPNYLRVDTDVDSVQRYGLNMTDSSFDPDVVYHITYDGWPIQRQVDKDGQTNPIGFNSPRQVASCANALKAELVAEYTSDTSHTEAVAQKFANERIKIVKEEI